MGDAGKRLISFIVPVFNEEANIVPLREAVARVMAPLAHRYDYEILFTDNHSTDRSFEILSELARTDPRVRVLRYSRNFGYQRSIHTGYARVAGDAAIQLDCDLQDPPELVADLIRLWEEGYDAVYGIRRSRREGWWINATRFAFYRLIDLLSEEPLPLDAGDFRLVDRRLLEELKKIEDSRPYLRGALATLGFRQIGVPYNRAPRLRGQSKFLLRDYVNLAVDGILNHSIVPLRIAFYTGILVSALTLVGLVGYAVSRLLLGQHWPRGFATTTILILFSLSLNALFLGIIGEYLGRIYLQVKKRPLTIIERELNTAESPRPE